MTSFSRKDMEKFAPFIAAYVAGKRVQFRVSKDDKWYVMGDQFIIGTTRDFEVRILPDSVNWKHVDKKYNFMARDSDGKVYLFSNKPYFMESKGQWFYRHGDTDNDCTKAECLASYKQGDTDWDQSLICRPGFEDELDGVEYDE